MDLLMDLAVVLGISPQVIKLRDGVCFYHTVSIQLCRFTFFVMLKLHTYHSSEMYKRFGKCKYETSSNIMHDNTVWQFTVFSNRVTDSYRQR